MKKSALIIGWILVYFFGFVYLALPSPSIVDLPEALKSNEPGDTWQNINTKAFFTDWDRDRIINYYRANFHLRIAGYSLPNLRLNYRPEDTGTYVRKHIDSYYLEEIVIPFRESIFINGWDPKNAPSMAHLSAEEKKRIIIVVDGREFQQKITLRWYQSDFKYRITVWTLTALIAPLVFMITFKSFVQLIAQVVAVVRSKK